MNRVPGGSESARKRLVNSSNLMCRLAIFTFAYSWLAGLCLQLWLIPLLFSQSGSVDGLVILDSLGFDRIAKEKAAEIASLGWSAWELRPRTNSPAGIASAFYVLFGPSPSSMLPFNALVHALSACVVMAILRNYFSAFPAALGALVFVLNPGSLEWVSQIHKDGVFILGNLLFVFGVLGLFGNSKMNGKPVFWQRIELIIAPIIGTLLVWVARPYWVQIMLLSSLSVSIPFVSTIRSSRDSFGWRTVAAATLVVLIAIQFWLARYHTTFEPADVALPVASQPTTSGESISGDLISGESMSQDDAGKASPTLWQLSGWMPAAIEGRFYRLATARRAAMTQGGNTLVDSETRFNSVGEIVCYIPRALQLGLFSPLPELWGGQASTPAMTLARKVMGPVTIGFYVCLLGLVLGIYQLRRDVSVWIMLGLCFIGILLFAITYPNIGTLMRYRYGFYMLLISFGLAFWADFLLQKGRAESLERLGT